MDKTYFIGNLISTHRLGGTLKINSSFYLLEDIKGLSVLATNDAKISILTVKDIRIINDKKALIDFVEINGIDEAKTLIGYKVYIRKDLVPDYEEEENLISYKVYQNNEYIGMVVDIMQTSAHDILVIEDDNQKEILVPYIDVFVKEIDDEHKNINVALIEGMI